MNNRLLFRSIALLATAVYARGDDLPTKFNFDRYEGMLERSPFAVASAVAFPTAVPNFARDLYVANAAKSPQGAMVTIASTTDKDFKKYLTSKTEVDGYSIARIKWSKKIGETKVTISKDRQFATLSFGQMVLVQPLPNRPLGVLPKPSQISSALPPPTSYAGGVVQRIPPSEAGSASPEH